MQLRIDLQAPVDQPAVPQSLSPACKAETGSMKDVHDLASGARTCIQDTCLICINVIGLPALLRISRGLLLYHIAHLQWSFCCPS